MHDKELLSFDLLKDDNLQINLSLRQFADNAHVVAIRVTCDSWTGYEATTYVSLNEIENMKWSLSDMLDLVQQRRKESKENTASIPLDKLAIMLTKIAVDCPPETKQDQKQLDAVLDVARWSLQEHANQHEQAPGNIFFSRALKAANKGSACKTMSSLRQTSNNEALDLLTNLVCYLQINR